MAPAFFLPILYNLSFRTRIFVGVNVSNLLLAVLMFAGLQSADDVAEKLRICAAIENSESRLACFDAIGRTSAVEPAAVPEVPAEPAAVPDVPAEPATPEVQAEPVPEPAQAPPEPEAPGSVEPADIPKASAPAETPGTAEPTGLGAETVAREEKKKEKKKKAKQPREIVNATIVRVTPQLDGRWSVTLDNGQVWRETQGSKVGLPDEGAAVELSKGRFGGYRMQIDGLYRTAWVKRRK